MVVTDPPRDGTLAADWRVGRMPKVSRPEIRVAPATDDHARRSRRARGDVLLSPIAARGDYGQWLMTSRYYLGEDVPEYRTITALPPVVPLLIAGVRLLVPDPIAALHVVTVGLLVAVGGAFFASGTLIFASRWVGTFSAVIASARHRSIPRAVRLRRPAAVRPRCCACACLWERSRPPVVSSGSSCAGGSWERRRMALAALAHVGTGTIAVPTGMAAAGLVGARAAPPRVECAMARAAPSDPRQHRRCDLLAGRAPARKRRLPHESRQPRLPRPRPAVQRALLVLAHDGGRRGRRHCAHRWRRPGALAPANRRISCT